MLNFIYANVPTVARADALGSWIDQVKSMIERYGVQIISVAVTVGIIVAIVMAVKNFWQKKMKEGFQYLALGVLIALIGVIGYVGVKNMGDKVRPPEPVIGSSYQVEQLPGYSNV